MEKPVLRSQGLTEIVVGQMRVDQVMIEDDFGKGIDDWIIVIDIWNEKL